MSAMVFSSLANRNRYIISIRVLRPFGHRRSGGYIGGSGRLVNRYGFNNQDATLNYESGGQVYQQPKISSPYGDQNQDTPTAYDSNQNDQNQVYTNEAQTYENRAMHYGDESNANYHRVDNSNGYEQYPQQHGDYYQINRDYYRESQVVNSNGYEQYPQQQQQNGFSQSRYSSNPPIINSYSL